MSTNQEKSILLAEMISIDCLAYFTRSRQKKKQKKRFKAVFGRFEKVHQKPDSLKQIQHEKHELTDVRLIEIQFASWKFRKPNLAADC